MVYIQQLDNYLPFKYQTSLVFKSPLYSKNLRFQVLDEVSFSFFKQSNK